MPLKAGAIKDIKTNQGEDLANSMTKAIQLSFETNWRLVMKDEKGDPLTPPGFEPQMQLLFASIAQGIVNHLVENKLSIDIEYASSLGTIQKATIKITS